MPEWTPEVGEMFIWKNLATLRCVKRVKQPGTGKRCLIGRNVTGSGYLDGELLDFEECRPYWEPTPGDRIQLAVNWFSRFELGKQGMCLDYFVDPKDGRLMRVVFDDGQHQNFQPIWFMPADAPPG